MPNQIVVAITGPTGAGKSTISALLAKQIPMCVNIDADTVKHYVVNGFIYDNSEKGVAQWELLGKNIGVMAKNFHDSGYNVIINGYINEPAWENITKYIELTHKFLLLPHVDKIAERDSGRTTEVAMGSDAVRTHYEYFSANNYYDDFEKIDSSEQSVDGTVGLIMTKVQ